MSESLGPPLPVAEDASSSATKSGISFGKKRSAISLSLKLRMLNSNSALFLL